jgi:CHAT domain-containing protein
MGRGVEMRVVRSTALALCLTLSAWAQTAAAPDLADLLGQGDEAKTALEFPRAIAAYRAALELARAGGNLKSEATALLRLATSEYYNGDYAAAEQHARESLAAHQKLGNKVGQASDLRLLGNAQHAHGDFPAAEASNRQALALHQEIGDRKGIADDLNNLAVTLREFDPVAAMEYFGRAQQEFDALGNDLNRSTALDNLGLAYQSVGDYRRALEYGHLALVLARKAGDLRMQGIALNSLGIAQTYLGNYRDALAFFDQALERHKDFAWGRAQTTTNIGVLYRSEGNHALAAEAFARALDLNASIGDRNLEADSHYNLALEFLAVGQRAAARTHFEQGLDLSRRYGYLGMAAQCLAGVARIQALTGARADAEVQLKQAIETLRAIPDPPHLAPALLQLADLELETKRPAAALEAAHQAQTLALASELPDMLWQAQLAAGRALRSLGRVGQASSEFRASISTIESLRTRVAAPPASLPLYFSDKLEPYREMVELTLAAGETDSAIEFAEQSKSRVLGDLLRGGRVDLEHALSDSERSAERRLENQLVSLNLHLTKRPDTDARQSRDKVRHELEALQTSLYAAHPQVAFERGAHQPMKAREMTALADQTGAAILDYFVARERVYAFVLKPNTRPKVFTLPVQASALRKSAEEFRRELATHDLAYAVQARELYSMLVGPLEDYIAGEKAILIVPDGFLWDVAFQALQPAPQRFWIEDKTIAYVPSMEVLRETRRLARLQKSGPAQGALLALGDPSGQPPLPEAGRQVRQIEKLYRGEPTLVLTGDDATENRFRAEAGKYRVVHLAVHAILDDQSPMYSRALLAQTNGYDGFLEARELLEYNLRAELLVLSACDSARGQAAAGEGINGMLWAAFAAGASTTVASLWQVDSTSSADLMISFHERWIEARVAGIRFAKAASLRQASLDMIRTKTYSHPFYWAAYIVAGSPD